MWRSLGGGGGGGVKGDLEQVLSPEEVSQYEKHIGRTFGEATHVVGVPGLPEGDVQAHAVAPRHQAPLHVAADAVEHLEFEAIERNLPVGDESADLADDRFVVGGKRGINTVLQEIAGEVEVTPVRLGRDRTRPANSEKAPGDTGDFLSRAALLRPPQGSRDRKSTRLNSGH